METKPIHIKIMYGHMNLSRYYKRIWNKKEMQEYMFLKIMNPHRCFLI